MEAVDNALRILALLSSGQPVRVTDAAEELGVARSSAHRLLQTLSYRRFAVQRKDRAYVAGPALSHSLPRRDYVFVQGWLRPVLRDVHNAIDETVHLMVRDGAEVLFLDSIEARQSLRVGSRRGVRLRAEHTSGGKALLAHLPWPMVRSLLTKRDEQELCRFERMLDRTRQYGYGINCGESERGISAVGVCVPEPGGKPFAAVALSAPTLRFRAVGAQMMADQIRASIARVVHPWESPPLTEQPSGCFVEQNKAFVAIPPLPRAELA